MKYLLQQTKMQAENKIDTFSPTRVCFSQHSGLSRAVHAHNFKSIRTAADGAIAGSALLGALFSSAEAFIPSKRFYKSYTSSRTVSGVALANLECQKRCRLNLPVSSRNLARGAVALLLSVDVS